MSAPVHGSMGPVRPYDVELRACRTGASAANRYDRLRRFVERQGGIITDSYRTPDNATLVRVCLTRVGADALRGLGYVAEVRRPPEPDLPALSSAAEPERIALTEEQVHALLNIGMLAEAHGDTMAEAIQGLLDGRWIGPEVGDDQQLHVMLLHWAQGVDTA